MGDRMVKSMFYYQYEMNGYAQYDPNSYAQKSATEKITRCEEKQKRCCHSYSSPKYTFKFGNHVCFTCTICGHKLRYEYTREY